MRYYHIYVRYPSGMLHHFAEVQGIDARRALLAYRELYPDHRGPFVVLPPLTAAPLCVD